MQQRRGYRSRLGAGSNPKYGEKGKAKVPKRYVTIVVALVLIMGLGFVQMSYKGGPGGSIEHSSKPLDENWPPVVKTVDNSKGSAKRQPDNLPPPYSKLVQYLDVDKDMPIGYVRIPKIRSEGTPTSDDGKLHIIFSSGCNYFQHWQSEFLLATAHLVGQRGRITRIVSGCYDKKAETVAHRHQTFPGGKNDLLVPVDILNRSVNENFGLFITPSFEGAIDFPWINKPSSIKYFMKHARGELDRLGETVVAILDPDFVFIKPLTQTGENMEDIIARRGQDREPGRNVKNIDVVLKGRPVSQRYGLEGGWVSSKYDLKKITGEENSKASKWTYREAAQHTSVGPPLMYHVDDLDTLSVLWERYMRPVLQVDTDILADMWAMSIAAAQLDLRHTTLDHYMISSWGEKGEAYEWINKWKTMSCLDPKPSPGDKQPTFIHLASNFKAPNKKGPWMFHKGHVPATILDCDTPLIVESPDNLFDISEKGHPRQRAWVLCNTVSRLNKVVLLYKKKFCPIGFEQRKLIRLIQSKTEDRGCSERRDKWCYPLAQIEGLPKNWRNDIA